MHFIIISVFFTFNTMLACCGITLLALWSPELATSLFDVIKWGVIWDMLFYIFSIMLFMLCLQYVACCYAYVMMLCCAYNMLLVVMLMLWCCHKPCLYAICVVLSIDLRFRGSCAKTTREDLLNISSFDIIKKGENEASRFWWCLLPLIL